MIAAAQGNLDAVRVLLRYSPDANAVDKFGKRAHEKAKTQEITMMIQEAAIDVNFTKTTGGTLKEQGDDLLNQHVETASPPKRHIAEAPLTPKAKQQLIELSSSNNKQMVEMFAQKMRGKLQHGVLENLIEGFEESMKNADSTLRKNINGLLYTESKKTLRSVVDVFNNTMLDIFKKHGIKSDPKFLITEEDISKVMDVQQCTLTAGPKMSGTHDSSHEKQSYKGAPVEGGSDLVSSINAQLESIGSGLVSDLQGKMHDDVKECMLQIKEAIGIDLRSVFTNFRSQLENSIQSLIREKVIRVSKQIKDQAELKRKKRQSVSHVSQMLSEPESVVQLLTSRMSYLESTSAGSAMSPREKSARAYSYSRISTTAAKKTDDGKSTPCETARKTIDYQYVQQHSAKVKPSVVSITGKKSLTFTPVCLSNKIKKPTLDYPKTPDNNGTKGGANSAEKATRSAAPETRRKSLGKLEGNHNANSALNNVDNI